jgi:undecaprenyl diphosphate synthase
MIADGVRAEEVTDELVSSYLHTAGLPDPDLIIRTAGELRVSNFLLWQGAYSEFYSTSIYWPDFDQHELRRAIDDFGQRQRRFGSI